MAKTNLPKSLIKERKLKRDGLITGISPLTQVQQ